MTEATTSGHLVGGAFALTSAALWAAASILWTRLGKDVSPFGMNLGKGLIALVCLGVGFLFTGFPQADFRAWVILGASGLIGISLGDTTYFAALLRLGPRRMLVVTTLTPLLASVLAIAFLGEVPTWRWALGAALCIGGVTEVLRERLPDGADRGSWRAGIGLGLLTVACDAVGTVMSKVGMADMDSQGPMDATFIRVLFGVVGLVIYGLVGFRIASWLAPFRAPRLFGVLILASVTGTFLGIWFALAALWHTDVKLASILNSTSPLFILPLAVIFLKERLTLRSVAGAFVAVAGVAVLLAR